jgi:HTH-type transcriptional regulator/antitoxin HipB
MERIARAPKQIGDALRRRRKLGLNQTSLGEKTNLRQATILSVETGLPGTRLSTLCDSLAALQLGFVLRPRSKASPSEIEAIF